MSISFDPRKDICPLINCTRQLTERMMDSWFYPTAQQCRKLAQALNQAADEMEKK
jgi:hypothetical protein